MEQIWEAVLENLTYTGIGLGLFIICYVANMAFSIWYNVKVMNQEFDWKKILNSIVKIIAFGAGTILMCIGITTIPIFCDYIGLVIPAEYAEVFEKLAIVAVFIYSACRYLVEAYARFKAILNSDNDIARV